MWRRWWWWWLAGLDKTLQLFSTSYNYCMQITSDDDNEGDDERHRNWDITISGLQEQTSAILEIFFRFLFEPYHLIGIHQAAKFHVDHARWSYDVISTLKMAAAEAQFNSGLGFGAIALFKRSMFTANQISIYGWDIAIFQFREKQTTAILTASMSTISL